MLVAVGAFAAMDALLKLLAGAYSPMQVSALRGAASVPFLVVPLLLTRRLHELKPVNWRLQLLRGVLTVIVMGGFVYAVRELSLADAYGLFLIAPLVVTALAVPILGEHVDRTRWIVIGIGLCGALVMLRPTGTNLVSLGALGALLSALAYAVSALTVRILTRTDTTASIVFWAIGLMTLFCGLLALPDWRPIRPGDWLPIAGIGVFGAIAQHLLTEAFRLAPASVIAPFEYTALLWGMLIDWAVWSVFPSAHLFVGGGIVIASGLYLIWRERNVNPLAAEMP